MSKTRTASSMETVWAVRDARGFNANEKVFLFVVASRGVMKTSRETALQDCGFSKATFYRVIDSLTAKGVIDVTPGQYNPVSNKRDQTYYTINVEALHDSLSETEDSHTETNDSLSETDDSQRADNKVTVKGTDKVTVKETTTPAAPVGEQEEAERLINSAFAPYNFSSLSWEELQEAFKREEGFEPSPCVETEDPASLLSSRSAERAEFVERPFGKKYPEVLDLTGEQYVVYRDRRNKRDSHEEAMAKATYEEVDAW